MWKCVLWRRPLVVVEKGAAMADTARKKLVVDMPPDLYEETQAAMREQQITQSKLVRKALTQYLAAWKQKKVEEELREGYLANASLDASICQEFTFADADIVD